MTQVANRHSLSSSLFLWDGDDPPGICTRIENIHTCKQYFHSDHFVLTYGNRTTRSYPGWWVGEEKLNTMAGQHTCAKMATCLQPSDMSPCCVLDKRPNCYAIWSFHHDTSCKQALAQLVTFSLRWGRSSRYLYTYRKHTHMQTVLPLWPLCTYLWESDYPILPHPS